MKIGIVTSDVKLQGILEAQIQTGGHETVIFNNLLSALETEMDLIFAQWGVGEHLPELLEGLRAAAAESAPVPVVVLVPAGSIALMQRARAAGATDVLFSPPDAVEVTAEIEEACNDAHALDITLQERLRELRRQKLIGESANFRQCLNELKLAANCDANVLITGETGTGKEIFTQAIHYLSRRAGNPFIAVNCAGLPRTLLETELFGHVKGAFTGAEAMRTGRFEVVGAGTLLLDEIGDIEIALQVKLLRVIEQRVFQRVGENKDIQFNARLVCATSVNLEDAVTEGHFRRDLIGRIDQFRIALPALRERRSDIPILAGHFLRKHAKGRLIEISRSAMEMLEVYDFPMNIRQLENAIISALARSDPGQLILPRHLPEEITTTSSGKSRKLHRMISLPESMDYKQAREYAVQAIDDLYLSELLRKYGGTRLGLRTRLGLIERPSAPESSTRIKPKRTQMAEYFRVVYVNTLSPGEDDHLRAVKLLRDWSWERSALVRWLYVEPGDDLAFADTADLLVLDWSSKNANSAEEVCKQVRTRRPDLPIIIIESYQGQTPTRDVFLAGDSRSYIVTDPTDREQIIAGFTSLNLAVPSVRVNVHPDPNNLAALVLIGWAGPERLPLMIQKYFPQAGDAYIMPVGGGWSDAKLCRLFVDNDENEYFFKFFPDRQVYTSELVQHAEAKRWLGSATVDLKLIPDIAGDIVDQNEAFPDISPSRFPVCYESASTRSRRRETYKQLYQEQSDNFTEGVLKRLIEILATNQSLAEAFEPPWSDSTSIGFRLTPELKMSILDSIQDLAMYGPGVCGEQQWRKNAELIQKAIYQPIPKLYEPVPVTVGHVHGDPNPRNCLVSPTDEKDLLMIDCGGYQSRGRLVSDLALIERDIKLVLMGTEHSAGGFFDLEVAELPAWCRVESDSISRGLDYSPDFAPSSPATSKRAYRLVGNIRERAKQISGVKDSYGRHYFGALLFWTLDILKYPAVRPTKKLLALHSAAEIIGRFG